MIQCGNLCLETTSFTLLQALALSFGLGGSLIMYLLLNSMLRAQNLVDFHAVFHVFSCPAAIMVAPLATVAALGPVAALKYLWIKPVHSKRAPANALLQKTLSPSTAV
eukprot:Tamp_15110.p2 GENE.Tamp_15110~~Tamp_15110.p2  ORF type:complete len:108 (-),score=15.90 Tamp_15110:211-534(-)